MPTLKAIAKELHVHTVFAVVCENNCCSQLQEHFLADSDYTLCPDALVCLLLMDIKTYSCLCFLILMDIAN